MSKVGRPIGKLHQEDVRRKIQASQLINRLTDHALGEADLSNTQVRAIEILLKKIMPDLSAIEHSGDAENPMAHRVEIAIIDAPK